jgi:hypothetical protein
VRGAVALLELLALALRQLVLGLRLREPRPSGLQLGLELTLALGEPCSLRLELPRAALDPALPLVERLRALPRRPLASGDGLCLRRGCPLIGGRASEPVADGDPAALELALEVVELALPRGDGLGSLAQRLLQLLELAVPRRLVGVPARGELAREPQQLLTVEIGVRILRRSRVAARRPRVEPLFPAVYRSPFRQQMLTM